MSPDALSGQMIAQYRLEEKLGQGGMGTVYRAWDVNLQRRVALKILTADPAKWRDGRARFLAEARAVAALNHPNIVTVYEIGQSEPGDEAARDYIAMEFVPGKNLRAVLKEGALPVETALRYAVQIADGLAAAHAAGITHRDLKPANIMVSEGGRIRILDFGIARRAESLHTTDETFTIDARTMPGRAIGTPQYMSPEQAQGKPVDGRSDIFSLGAILFEMLTGRSAFAGDSMAALMVAILTLDPPPVSVLRPVPEELDRLIARCLRKDVELRLQHAGDLRIALQELSGGLAMATAAGSSSLQVRVAPSVPVGVSQPSALPGTAPAPQRRRFPRWPMALAVLSVAAAIGAGVFVFRPKAPPAPFAGELKRVTSDAGLTAWPTISRDGKFIAYASDRPNDKNLHIWLQQIGGGDPVALTRGDSDDTEPCFSPDGTRIAFHSDRDGGGIYLVPAIGGEAHLIAKKGRNPRFSPDGSKIAYWTGGDLGSIYVIYADGSSAPQPFQPGFAIAQSPLWSPDGRSILFNGAPRSGNGSGAAKKDWWVGPVSGGTAVATGLYWRLRKLDIWADAPTEWLSGDRLLFSGLQGDTRRLWSMRFSPQSSNDDASPERLTYGTSDDQNPSAGGVSESARIAFSSTSDNTGIWTVPVDIAKGRVSGEKSRIDLEGGTTVNQLTISTDGRRIAYLSDHAGHMQPTIHDMATGHESTVSNPDKMWAPSVSPDGRTLAWSVYEGRIARKIRRAAIGADGQLGLPETVCGDCGTVVSWSPDAQSLLYSKSNPDRVLLLEPDSGKSYELLRKEGSSVWGARVSPDGKWLTLNITPTASQSQIFIAPFDPARRAAIPFSEWIPVTDGSAWDDKPRWAPDGNSIYFISERDGFRCIWWQRLDRATRRPLGPAAPVLHFHQARLSMRNLNMGSLSFQVAADRLIFGLGELTGNIWMLSSSK